MGLAVPEICSRDIIGEISTNSPSLLCGESGPPGVPRCSTGPHACSLQTASWSVQPFCTVKASWAAWQTDRQTRWTSVTISLHLMHSMQPNNYTFWRFRATVYTENIDAWKQNRTSVCAVTSECNVSRVQNVWKIVESSRLWNQGQGDISKH